MTIELELPNPSNIDDLNEDSWVVFIELSEFRPSNPWSPAPIFLLEFEVDGESINYEAFAGRVPMAGSTLLFIKYV